MASQAPTTSTLSPKLEQRIKEHKLEVARLREEFGDPAEELDRFILERFTVHAFLPEESAAPDERKAFWEEGDDSVGW